MRRMYSEKQIKDIVENGNLNVTGKITGGEIVENMSGYSFTPADNLASNGITLVYVGAVKNGNKVTFVIFGTFKPSSGVPSDPNPAVGSFNIPEAVGAKIYIDENIGSRAVDNDQILFFNSVVNAVAKYGYIYKQSDTQLGCQLFGLNTGFGSGVTYSFRYEVTFLLSDNLAPQE